MSVDVDIVYIVGDGAADLDDAPLKWSLRSLEKFASGVGRVIVCGRIPAWLSDEAVKVPLRGEHGGKSWNILYAYRSAIQSTKLRGPFLYSSDDHYLCRPAFMPEWPRYYNKGKWDGRLLSRQEYARTRKGIPIKYQATLFKTGEVLRENGLSDRRACVHLDTWADPRDVESAIRLAERYASRTVGGFEPTCMISAFYEQRMVQAGLDPRFVPYMSDEKAGDVEACQAKVDAGLPGFSTTSKAEHDPAVRRWMKRFYGGRSRWEK